MKRVYKTVEFLLIVLFFTTFTFHKKAICQDKVKIIGRGKIGIIENQSFVEVNPLPYEVSKGDTIVVARFRRLKDTKKLVINSNVKLSKIYGNKRWILEKGPNICRSCNYNKSIEDPEDVYIIYPNKGSYKYVDIGESKVPKNNIKKNVDLSLDVDGDCKVDIIGISYCKNKPRVSTDSIPSKDCLRVMKGYRFDNGKFNETYKSETPPYD